MLFARISPNADLYNYNLQVFNLFFYIPISVWIGTLGLGGMLLFLFMSDNYKFSRNYVHGLMFAAMLIIFIVFYGLPHIIEQNPRSADSWVHGRTASSLVINGHLDPNKFRYQSYPSSFMILIIIHMITSIEITLLLRIIPLFLVLMFFFTFTILIKELFKDIKIAIIASLIFGLSTFYLSFHFSPEAFGWILLFLLFTLLVKRLQDKTAFKASKKLQFLIILTVLGITITHLVTQISTVLILFTLFMLSNIWKIKQIKFSIVILPMLAMILFTAWTTFFGYRYISGIIKGFEVAFEKTMLDITSSIIARPLQEKIPTEITSLLLYRRSIYVVVPLLALCGIFLYWRKNNKKIDSKLTFLLSILTTGIILVPLTAFGTLPLERPIKLAFIPLSILSAYFIIQKKLATLVLIFLLTTIPINFASFYWSEVNKMTHDWEISSAQFISANFHGTVLGEFKEACIMRFYGNFKKVYDDYQQVGERQPDIFNLTFIKKQKIELVYISQLNIMDHFLAGRRLEICTFVNFTLFNCVNSNEYSITLLRNQ
jgi:hypothetical protein